MPLHIYAYVISFIA